MKSVKLGVLSLVLLVGSFHGACTADPSDASPTSGAGAGSTGGADSAGRGDDVDSPAASAGGMTEGIGAKGGASNAGGSSNAVGEGGLLSQGGEARDGDGGSQPSGGSDGVVTVLAGAAGESFERDDCKDAPQPDELCPMNLVGPARSNTCIYESSVCYCESHSLDPLDTIWMCYPRACPATKPHGTCGSPRTGGFSCGYGPMTCRCDASVDGRGVWACDDHVECPALPPDDEAPCAAVDLEPNDECEYGSTVCECSPYTGKWHCAEG